MLQNCPFWCWSDCLYISLIIRSGTPINWLSSSYFWLFLIFCNWLQCWMIKVPPILWLLSLLPGWLVQGYLGDYYLLWAQAFCIFISAQNKLAHLFDTPHATTNLTYVTLLTWDYSVITWLLNNFEKISDSVLFLITAKKMWDILKMMYVNEKNPSRVFWDIRTPVWA